MAVRNFMAKIADVFAAWSPDRRLPGPGAMNNAFLIQDLSPITPIGGGTVWYGTQGGVEPALFMQQQIGIDGLGGLQQGQLVGGVLYNPTTGKT